MNAPESHADLVAHIADSEVGKVKLALSDIDGVLRGKFVHKEKFLSAVEDGFGFCDVVLGWDCEDACYDNVEYTGWHTGYPDARVRIDLGTHRRVPWEDNVDFFLCDFEDKTGAPLEVCPRQLLKRVIARLRETGFDARVGFEYEWFNFNETPQSLAGKGYGEIKPLTPGMFGYSVLRSGLNHPYFTALMDQLDAFGVPLEGLHTETGPGTFEAAILAAGPLEAADRAALFKAGVKQIAYGFDAIASFMARWNSSLPGCGGHIHQSLVDPDTGSNAFFDPASPESMTQTFQSFLAGQLYCVREILPLYAPTVNSYKRLVQGYWAPTSATWGYDNRTACFRVIPSSPKASRVECRVSGADANPYLALAASLASGWYGIANGLKLDDPAIEGSGYRNDGDKPLPRTLDEATEALACSHVARELFGEAFVDHFLNTRMWEWRQYREAVTDWELKRYFEII